MKLSIACFLILSFWSATQSVSAQNDSESKHHFYVGINLLSPFGSKIGQYSRQYSPIAANTLWMVYPEYRYSRFALRVPLKIPTTQVPVPEATTNYYWYYAFQYINISSEFGLKPLFYFQEPNETFQFYVGIANYFGTRYGFDAITYDTYALWSGTYTTPVSYFTEFVKSADENYTRFAISSGVQLQLKNGFGLGFDMEYLIGKLSRVPNHHIYTNYNSTNGDYTLSTSHYGYYDNRRTGFQVGLNLFYRIK